MNAARRANPTHHHLPRNKALVLQGGGALGSYQAGVYEELHKQHQHPSWIAGVSIGAINAALIAGNAPDKRVQRLHDFWTLVSSGPSQHLPAWIADRRTLNKWSASLASMFGIPGFFKPRITPALLMGGEAQLLSYYDTTPLRLTLERLVDFDRINAQEVRLSVGAVNVCTGNSMYFDNTRQKIGPEHIMASGALPPGFAPVEVEGEWYWDGGIVSNTPLQYLLDNHSRNHALVVMQVDLFNSRGGMPVTMSQVLTRQKDITYSSRTRMNTDALAANVNLQQAIADLIGKLPAALRNDASVKAVHAELSSKPIDIFHLIYRDKPYEGDSKDYEFSRATVEDHWEVGMRDVRRALSQPEALVSNAEANGVTTYDLGEPDAVRIKRPMTPPPSNPGSPSS
jgi:NTE family protein